MYVRIALPVFILGPIKFILSRVKVSNTGVDLLTKLIARIPDKIIQDISELLEFNLVKASAKCMHF